jgi:hypothetical protein
MPSVVAHSGAGSWVRRQGRRGVLLAWPCVEENGEKESAGARRPAPFEAEAG